MPHVCNRALAQAARKQHCSVDIEKGTFDLFRLNLHRPGKLADHLIHGELMFKRDTACAPGKVQAGKARIDAEMLKQYAPRGVMRKRHPLYPRIEAFISLRAHAKCQRFRFLLMLPSRHRSM